MMVGSPRGQEVTLADGARHGPAPASLPTWLFAVCYSLITAYLLSASPLLALLPVLFALALIPLLRVPRSAPLVVLFLAPLLSGMPRGQIVPYFRPNELVLIIAFAAYILVFFLGRVRRPIMTFLDGAFLIFLIARCVLPFIAHPLEVTADTSQLIKFFLAPFQYYLLYRLILGTATGREDLIVLLRVIVAASVVVAIVGLLQALRVHEIEILLQTYYPSNKTIYTYEHSQRVTSLFAGGWNVCGYYLSQALLLTLVLRRFEAPGIARAVLTGVSVLLIMVMGLTFSFTTVITLLVALAFMGWKEQKLKRYLVRFLVVGVVIALVLVIGFGPALHERLMLQFRGTWVPLTILKRIDFWWNTALPLISQHLIFGIGPSLYDWLTAENYYVFLAANGGLVCLGGFLAFVVFLWRRFSRLLRKIAATPKAPMRELAYSLTLLSLVLFLQALIASNTGHYFEYSGGTEILWSVWTMALVADRLNSGKPLDVLTPTHQAP